MKKNIQLITCLLACFLFQQKTQAQDWGVHFGGGLNLSFVQSEDLNSIVKRYNETRPWLSKEMKDIKTELGLSLEVGGFFNHLYLDFDYTTRKQKTLAQGTPNVNTSVGRRELRLKQNTYGIGMGILFNVGYSFQLIIGGTYDLGKYNFQTRTYNLTDVVNPPDFQDIFITENNKTRNVGGFLRIILGNLDHSGAKLMIEPYYSYGLEEYPLLQLNYTLNPATYTNDDNANLKFRNSYGGLKIGLVFQWKSD